MISNKQISLVLIAMIAISIIGMISLVSNISKMEPVSRQVIGRATTDTGNVSINIQDSLSIIADTDAIDFQTCAPQGGQDSTINSEGTQDTATVCSSFATTELTIRNDGNVEANVTFNASDCSPYSNAACTFLDSFSNNAWIAYKVTNNSDEGIYNGGCYDTLSGTYTNITNVNMVNESACSKLKDHATDNSFEFDVQIRVPQDVNSGADDVIFTFLANNVV